MAVATFFSVGERAERVQDARRVPPRLVLDALALDGASPQEEAVDVDG